MIVRRALAWWSVAAVVTALGVLATAQAIRMHKPLYKSEAVIVYRPVVSSDGANSTEVPRTLGAKLKETLIAQSNLKEVIDELHLYADVVDKRGHGDAVEMFRKQIEFKPRSNDTFAISFQGSTREEAQQVTARLADMLAEQIAKASRERAQAAVAFLEVEKGRVDEELERSEEERAQFMAENPEFATDSAGRDGAAVRADQKKRARALAGARPTGRMSAGGGAGRLDAEAPRGPTPTGALVAAAGDRRLIAARTQAENELMAARKELSDRSLRFTEHHPDVRTAAARVAAAEAALTQAEQAILDAQSPSPPASPAPVSEDPYASALPRAPVARAPAAIHKAPADPVDPRMKPPEELTEKRLVELEREWARLNREVSRSQEEQSQLHTRLFSAELNANAELAGHGATIAILDPAYRPARPVGTPSKTILLGGLVASLLAGIALAVARGVFLDDRLFDASEIEALGLVPIIEVVPRAKLVLEDGPASPQAR